MIHAITGRSANDVWINAANTLQASDDVVSRPSRIGLTRDIGQTAVCISNPRLRWVVSRRPAINPAFAIAEAIWILAGRQDSHFVNYFNRSLPQYAGSGSTYHGAYGHRLRYAQGFDQLQAAYQALNCNTYSRQVVLQIWDAHTDMPNPDGTPRAPDIPCNVAAMLKINGRRLDWTQIMRSNDVFRGMPYNIVQFTILQEVVAGWLGVELGDFHLFTDSLHAYETDLVDLQATQQSFLKDREIVSLALTKDDSDRVIRLLVEYVDRIIQPDMSCESLISMAHVDDLPDAYRNLLCIMAAEALRRKRDTRAGKLVDEFCSDPWLRLVWNNWLNRSSSQPIEQRSSV